MSGSPRSTSRRRRSHQSLCAARRPSDVSIDSTSQTGRYGSCMPRALWVKAPFVLGRHRSVLLAVVCASFLVALAAASAPLLRAGAESEALKGKLQQLSPLAAGLTIETRGSRDRNIAAGDEARRAAAVRLAESLPFVEAPLLTTTTADAQVSGSARYGGRPDEVVPMARTGAMAHVHRLSGNGHGAWVAASVARLARVRPGGQIGLEPISEGSSVPVYRLPVGAVYLPLDQDLDNPYWVNFLARIRSSSSDPPPLPTFLLMSPADLYRTARLTNGGSVANVFELPIAAGSMTPARAKEVAVRFAALRHRLSLPTPFARELGCPCRSSSSIEAAVTLARQSVAALTPVISLLAGFAAVIAIGSAFVAGVFNTRRRSAEARLSVVGGEPRAVYGVRLVLEAFLPSLAGAAAGVAVAVGLTRELTPKGTIDGSVLHSALVVSAGAVLVAIAAIALGGLAARGPAIERPRRRSSLFRVPWELPVLIAAAISYVLRRERRRARQGPDDRRPSALDRAALSTPPGGGDCGCRLPCCALGRATSRNRVGHRLPRLAPPRRGACPARPADGDGRGRGCGRDVRRSAPKLSRLEQLREGVCRERCRRAGTHRPREGRPAELPVSCNEGRGELRQRDALRRHRQSSCSSSIPSHFET